MSSHSWMEMRMFCARCGTQVGAHDAVCPQCGLNLRLPGAVRMTDPGSYDETRVQSPVGEGATPTREIPRVQTPSEPGEWQDSMPTQQWPVQDSTPTQQWTTNSQSGPQQPSQGQYRDLGASQMPDDWFRDPEAERTRVMAAVPENPVFTPPPPPSTPAMAYPPPPSGDSPRHRNVLIGLAVGLLVLVVLGAVLLFAGGLKGRSGSEPAVVTTPSASSQPTQSASEDPQATSIDTTPSFLRLALHGVHLTRHRAIRLHLIVALGTRRDGISHLKSERARCRTDGTNRRGTKGVSVGQFVSHLTSAQCRRLRAQRSWG